MMKTIDVKNKILLFDLDGTLVDTEKLSEKVLFEDCVEKGIIDQEANLKKAAKMVIGRTWKAAIQEVIQEFSLSLDPLEWEKDLKSRYQALLHQGIELVPGVKQKLAKFKEKSRFMGLVTGSSRAEVEIVLNAEGLAPFFDQLWCAEDYSQSKPSPAPFLTAIQSIRSSLNSSMRSASNSADPSLFPQKSDVLIFEDSVAGIEAAVQAGVSFIQVTHAHAGVAPDPRATLVISDWNEIHVE